MPPRLRVVLIGAGRVGSRFDEEEGRRQVWSHGGAYLALSNAFVVTDICDPSPENLTAARKRFPEARYWSDVAAITDPSADVVSICTPAPEHRPVLEQVLNWPHPPKAIWCEKPLSDSLKDAAWMVAACERQNISLVVSHTRRWLPIWCKVRDLVRNGNIGQTVSVRISMPNRLWTIGAHAVDLCLMLGGTPAEVSALAHLELTEDNEPAFSFLIRFKEGGYGIVQTTGLKQNLVVEAEVIGSTGRIMAKESDGSLVIEEFVPSKSYADYRELLEKGRQTIDNADMVSPFVEIAREVAELAIGKKTEPTCSGRQALESIRVLAAAPELAARNSQAGF